MTHTTDTRLARLEVAHAASEARRVAALTRDEADAELRRLDALGDVRAVGRIVAGLSTATLEALHARLDTDPAETARLEAMTDTELEAEAARIGLVHHAA